VVGWMTESVNQTVVCTYKQLCDDDFAYALSPRKGADSGEIQSTGITRIKTEISSGWESGNGVAVGGYGMSREINDSSREQSAHIGTTAIMSI